MKRRPKRDPIDPAPRMMRGETEFEEKRIICEFELIFKRVVDGYFTSFKEGYEFLFREAYFTGKIAAKRELNSNVTVANRAESQKETT